MGMIINRQRSVAVATKPLAQFLEHLRETFRLPEEAVTVCLVSDAEIARLNRAFRGKRGPTDVLSFPVNENKPTQRTQGAQRAQRTRRAQKNETKPGGWRANGSAAAVSSASSASYLGDIAISPEIARRNARRFGRTVPEELRVLILHGVLHLLGYDHETDRGEMDRVERRLRRQLGLR